MVYEGLLNDINKISKKLNGGGGETLTFKGRRIAINEKTGKYRAYRRGRLYDYPVIDIIHGCQIDSLQDQRIMESWEQHFRDKKIPYVVVERDGCLVLFKRLIAEEKEGETNGNQAE